jgi:NSS family neurotransmitter:Na+ symporter
MSGLPPNRESFGSKFGIIAATAGSAIGLGNIWRYPYITGENGGAAFIIIYLAIVLIIGIPVMLSEFTIGRRSQQNVFGAFKKLAPGKPWFLIGIMGVAAAFMILAFYTVVAGWTLEYLYQSVINGFKGKSADELGTMFNGFVGSSYRPLLWYFVFMGLTALIVTAGVKGGIEKSTKIMMPLLFFLLIVLIVRSLFLPGAEKGISFLFKPDFSKITTSTFLLALGQAFFSLSIGMGTLITYGSYIPKKDNLASTAVSVVITDTLVALLAGLAIFPAVFAFGIEPASGAGLAFITIPNIFQQMAGGMIFSVAFFVLLSLAALTSTISVLEVIVAFFVEELKLKRSFATWIATVSVSLIGIMCVLSTSSLSEFKLFGLTVFQLMEYSTANILLPIGGMLIVIFIAWFYGRQNTIDELTNGGSLKARYLPVFIFVIKFLAPLAIAFVFLQGIGLINLK